MDMIFGKWNVRIPDRACSLRSLATELEMYTLDLVGVQVRWEKGALKGQRIMHFYMEKGMNIVT
jgi:hypothetical protein